MPGRPAVACAWRPGVRVLVAAVIAAAGLVTGWGLRAPISRLAVPDTEFSDTRVSDPVTGAASDPVTGAASEPAPSRALTGPPFLAVELITAVLFGGLAARVTPGLVLAAACWLATCCVALSWIDVAVHRLPDVLTAAAYAGTAGLLVAAAASSGHWHDLLRAVAGGLALAGVLTAVAVISRSALGLGDAKLAASLGTLLAWYGWLTLARGVAAGFVLGGVYGAALLASRRATRGRRIAFGPFMVAGAFLVILAVA
jgi:leader peptidase (prepilin peptidase) / N-methyltransferase